MRPIPAAEFSNLVAAIYDCALDPSLWYDTLVALSGRLRYRNSALVLQELPSARVLLDVTTGIGPEDLVRMRAYGAEVLEQWGGPAAVAALPLEEPTVLSRVDPRHTESRNSREWSRPLGVADTIAIGFSRDRDSLSSLGFGRHAEDGPIEDDDVDLARLFVPHLKRALTISRIPDPRRRDAAAGPDRRTGNGHHRRNVPRRPNSAGFPFRRSDDRLGRTRHADGRVQRDQRRRGRRCRRGRRPRRRGPRRHRERPHHRQRRSGLAPRRRRRRPADRRRGNDTFFFNYVSESVRGAA